ncbi:MAG: methionyl-tRNA formyltransferase [Syntrophales bacterium]|nr:methionyl-tRNA formyltransferase [Syntrophales bacterium]
MTSKAKITFMGTPEFAVPSLEKLISEGHRIEAVITQPDRPRGRGRQVQPSPVKIKAMEYGLPVYQPEKVKDPSFLEQLQKINPDLIVVVAFGQILPPEVLHLPPLGCINVHPSLLPKYRGPAPINWTLIRGEEVTGVTIMEMDEGIDTGNIILQETTAVLPDEIYDELHNRLALLGANLLVKAIDLLQEGKTTKSPQDHSAATYAPMIKKNDTLINWNQKTKDIINFIRGLSSTPGAFTFLDGKILKIFRARQGKEFPPAPPGTIRVGEGNSLMVASADGWVEVLELQLEGKKRMDTPSFLRGHRGSISTKLG